MRDNPTLSYVKGNLIAEESAVISIKERGFRFGDGVFETVRVAGGSMYQFDDHFNRLKSGLKQLKLRADVNSIPQLCKKLLQKNKITNGFIRISISRGEGSKGYLPDVKGEATIVIETIDKVSYTYHPVDLYVSNYRKIPSACLPSNVKTMQGLNSTLARIEAHENHCFEALLLNIEGYICEGSSCNIFWVKDNMLFTPSLECDILPGTVRSSVIRLSPIPVIEGKFTVSDLEHAEEVFITNVAWLVTPVKSLCQAKYHWDKFDFTEQIKQLILDDMGER